MASAFLSVSPLQSLSKKMSHLRGLDCSGCWGWGQHCLLWVSLSHGTLCGLLVSGPRVDGPRVAEGRMDL